MPVNSMKSKMYTEIKRCRICGNPKLASVLDLGNQYLTGVFPRTKTGKITLGPLELVKCVDDHNHQACGLLQLKHTYSFSEMFGGGYGYRSGLNQSMVDHLGAKVKKIEGLAQLKPGDLVIDIGSNDGTLLKAYRQDGLLLAGIDPSAEGFRKYYPKHIRLIPDFFSQATAQNNFGDKKAKVITSIAMFYDLESPLDFARQVSSVLADDGIWVFEQSYMPTMLQMNAYDTVCHEHLEYYSLKQIKWMTDKLGLKIIDLELNPVNGGSFSVTAAKSGSAYQENTPLIVKMLEEEKSRKLDTLAPYQDFKQRVWRHRKELTCFIHKVNAENKKIIGYGASTKGNVILQFCNLTPADIPFIAEVNPDKFGCYTPGTHIPIIPENEAKKMLPEYFLVLPWHFKDNIVEREQDYLARGGNLFFPLPALEVVHK